MNFTQASNNTHQHTPIKVEAHSVYAAQSMNVIFSRVKTALLFCGIFFTLCISNLVASQDAEPPQLTPNSSDARLEQDYQLITTATYRELTRNNLFATQSASLKDFIRAATAAEKQQPALAIGVITTNMSLLNSHPEADAIQTATRILLQNHAELLAQDVLKLAESAGDDYILGRVNFEFAKYHAEQNAWQQARNKLQKIDIANTLPKADADEAFIILGAALQQEKKHRESLSYYNKIKPDSKQYRIAQLNSAIAYIRQDWWTDAKISIDNALLADTEDSDGLTNRLHTVLGFSQLQNGFYRNARETFRKVKVKSDYSNRALLGLGMSALHQEDFVGALNAFNHLKNKDPNDISVMESYLLSAFTLEKLKQPKTASVNYSEAINFYEQKSTQYSTLINRLTAQRNTGSIERTLIETINTDLHKIQPQIITVTEKINTIQQLLAYQPSSNQQTALRQLNARMNDAYVALAAAGINKKQEILNSYLSQSRFGLAKLYDSP